jgi:hypothetical protein
MIYFKFLLTLVISIVLTSCNVLNKKFNSVNLISVKYLNKNDIASVVDKNTQSIYYEKSLENGFIVLEVNISKDLIEYLKDGGNTFLNNAYFCNNKSDIIKLGERTIFRNGVSSHDVLSRNNFYRNNDKQYFNIVLFTIWDENILIEDSKKNNSKYYSKYNLWTNPKDICVTLVGTNTVVGFNTNEIIISKDQIKNILNKK